MARGTTLRAIRIPDDIWQPAIEAAKERGETVSDIVRRALIEYVTPPPPDDQR